MTPQPGRWSLVVPVKRLAVAKTRLATLAGPHRFALALAFALDTTEAALACPDVAGVVVVTDEPVAARAAAALGATVVPDHPDAGLNPALAYGATVAAERHGATGVGALAADLPALRPGELSAALAAAADVATAFVRDAAGDGTTLLVASRREAFDPAFGPSSAHRHLGQGAVDLTGPGLESVRRDVDTAADLDEARELGVGSRTRDVLGRMGMPSAPATG